MVREIIITIIIIVILIYTLVIRFCMVAGQDKFYKEGYVAEVKEVNKDDE